jgi:hypothetical protein
MSYILNILQKYGNVKILENGDHRTLIGIIVIQNKCNFIFINKKKWKNYTI